MFNVGLSFDEIVYWGDGEIDCGGFEMHGDDEFGVEHL